MREWKSGCFFFFLPGLLYIGLGPEGSSMNPSSASELFSLFVKTELDHKCQRKSCQTHTHIKCYCWITYKCNSNVSDVWECFIMQTTPFFLLMGRPISQVYKITSSKQGQTIKDPNLTTVCSASGAILEWKGKKGDTHTPIHPPTSGQRDAIPNHPFG